MIILCRRWTAWIIVTGDPWSEEPEARMTLGCTGLKLIASKEQLPVVPGTP